MIERRYQYGQYVQEFYYPKLNSQDKNSRGDAVKEPRVIKHSARGGSQEGEGEDRTMANYPYMRGDKARRGKKLKSNANTPSNQRNYEYTPDRHRDVNSSNLYHDGHGINQSYTNNNQGGDSASRVVTKSYKITPSNYSHRMVKPDYDRHNPTGYSPHDPTGYSHHGPSPPQNPHVTKSVKVVNYKPHTKNISARNQEKMFSEKNSKSNLYRIKGAQPNSNIFTKQSPVNQGQNINLGGVQNFAPGKGNFFEEGGWGNNDGGRGEMGRGHGNIFENQYVNAGMGGAREDGYLLENNKSRQLANVSQNYNHVVSGSGGNISSSKIQQNMINGDDSTYKSNLLRPWIYQRNIQSGKR